MFAVWGQMADATTLQDADLRAPHVSNRLVRPVLTYFERTCGRPFTDQAIQDAGLPRDYLEDDGKWVSSLWTERFMVAVIRGLGRGEIFPPYADPVWQHWREMGRIAMTAEQMGPLFRTLKALGSPGTLYSNLPVLTRRGNKQIRIEAKVQGSGRAEIKVAPLVSAVGWYAASCWNFRGTLEAMPPIWGLPPAAVEHHECIFDPENPATECVYRLRYVERPLARWAGVAAAAAMGGGLGAAAVLALGRPELLGLGSVTGGATLLAAYFAWRLKQAEQASARDGRRIGEIADDADQRYADLWEEGQQLRRALLASKKLSGYLARDLVDEIVADPDREARLGGRTTHAAVLFADLVGFTSRCERMTPHAVVVELNRYFAHIDPAFVKHDGVIDKRMGDGVMAVFVPRGDADAREVRRRAVRCAIDLYKALDRCNAELVSTGAEPLQVRVGIAAGNLVQGTMGSDVKLEYTVIGDVVNLAARLESQARPGTLMVTTDVWQAFDGAPPDGCQAVGRQILSVKGKQAPVDVVEVAPRAF
jgi:class 3 adenylate cyclase